MSTRRTASSQKRVLWREGRLLLLGVGALVAEGVRLLFFSVIPDWHGGLVERR